jgi:hypothetical protein
MLRHLLQTVSNTLLSADADAVVGAEWRKPSTTRTTRRATAAANGSWTPESEPSTWPSGSCAPARTSRNGCWNGASWPSPR